MGRSLLRFGFELFVSTVLVVKEMQNYDVSLNYFKLE